MPGPADTLEALGRGPTVEARGAHSSRIERVPFVTATTRPTVVPAGRPAAERASYAGTGRVEAVLLIRLSIQDHGRFGGVIREGAHATVLWLS
jgi:hypothetical protein